MNLGRDYLNLSEGQRVRPRTSQFTLNLSQLVHPPPHFFSGLSFPLDPCTLVPFFIILFKIIENNN